MTEQTQPTALRLAARLDAIADDPMWANHAEISKTLCKESADELRRMVSAERTLYALGYADNGGEMWKPPLGKAPNFNLLDTKNARIAELEAEIKQLAAAVRHAEIENTRLRDHAANHLRPIKEPT